MSRKFLVKMMLVVLIFACTDLKASVRENFYCGVGLGDSIDSYSQNVSGGITVKRSRTLDHLVGSAFLGWGKTLCNFYVAAEVGTYFPKRSITIERPGAVFQGTSFVTSTSVQDYVTGDILLGFRPDDCFLCYLRGGASYSKLSFFQFTNEFSGVPQRNYSKNDGAWRVGVGVNYAITSLFGLGLDYIYTSYPDLNFSTSSTAKFKVKAYSNYLMLSAITSF